MLLLQDSQNSAGAYPQGHSCPPGRQVGWFCGQGELEEGLQGGWDAPGRGNAAELSLVSLQWTGIPESQVGMAAEMALSHRGPHKVLSEAELEEVAQRKPPPRLSLRGCLRKTR